MKHGFLGPGMEGPEVEEVQRLVGATVTGVYDEETELRVRGKQHLHKTVLRDGCFDAELEYVLRRAGTT